MKTSEDWDSFNQQWLTFNLKIKCENVCVAV